MKLRLRQEIYYPFLNKTYFLMLLLLLAIYILHFIKNYYTLPVFYIFVTLLLFYIISIIFTSYKNIEFNNLTSYNISREHSIFIFKLFILNSILILFFLIKVIDTSLITNLNVLFYGVTLSYIFINTILYTSYSDIKYLLKTFIIISLLYITYYIVYVYLKSQSNNEIVIFIFTYVVTIATINFTKMKNSILFNYLYIFLQSAFYFSTYYYLNTSYTNPYAYYLALITLVILCALYHPNLKIATFIIINLIAILFFITYFEYSLLIYPLVFNIIIYIFSKTKLNFFKAITLNIIKHTQIKS